MVEKKRRKGDSGEEVGKRGREGGRGGGGRFSPNVLKHAHTLHWLCRQLPWENPRPILKGGAFGADSCHMVRAANWRVVI